MYMYIVPVDFILYPGFDEFLQILYPQFVLVIGYRYQYFYLPLQYS